MTATTAQHAAAVADERDPRLVLLLALADDELVIGHRHSHWTGVAPHLEEDLAFSSIAQDEIGHAVVWYRIAADLAGPEAVRAIATHAPDDGDPVDALGLGRAPDEYRNALLVERDNGDWGYSIARQYLYDTADAVRLAALAESTWSPLAQATGPLRREERYHLLHARTWLDRLANGPVEARRRLTDGLSAALADAPGLFEPLPGEERLVAEGVLPVPHAELFARWRADVASDLEQVGLGRVLEACGASDAAPTGLGGRWGRHGDDFDAVWEELTGTYRAYPGARW